MHLVLHFHTSKASNMRSKAIPKQKSRHCETVQISHIFFEIFYCSPVNFDILQQNGCSKNRKGSPLLHFLALCDLPETSKKFRKKFPQFLVFWELLLSSVVEKVVFESYLALDMTPTWAVPGLLIVSLSILKNSSLIKVQRVSMFFGFLLKRVFQNCPQILDNILIRRL